MVIRREDLDTMDFSNAARGKFPPIHPGEILLEDWLKPLNMSQYRLAKEIGVPQRRIGEIVAGKRAISADTALRLAKFFGTDERSWLNLQSHYESECAKDALGDTLARIRRFDAVPLKTDAGHKSGKIRPRHAAE